MSKMNQHLILLFVISSTCKGQDVVLTTTHECCNVNDELTLEAEYKGSGTVAYVMWTVTGGATCMIINATTCRSPFPVPSGFPYGRMLCDCPSEHKYRLIVQTVERADLNDIWGVDFSMSTGSTSSGTQQQTVTECEPVNESNTGFPWWAKVLIVLVIVVVAAIIYGVYRQQQCLKGDMDCVKKFKCNKGDSLNEEHIPCTNQATIRQWNVTNKLDEGRKSFTNEVNKDIEQEIRTNLLNKERCRLTNEANENNQHIYEIYCLPEERRRLTNEANEDIQQKNEINPLNEESIPRTNTLNLPKPDGLPEERRRLTNEANEDIQQKNEINPLKEESIPRTNTLNLPKPDPTDEPTDEPNTRLTSLGARVEIEDIRHESDNNLLNEERRPLTNEANENIQQNNEINGLPEERRRLTNEANEDIQQKDEKNTTNLLDEENNQKEISNGDCVKKSKCNKGDTSVLSDQTLDRVPSEKEIVTIANRIGNKWQQLTLMLGLSQADFERAQANSPHSVVDQGIIILIKWVKNNKTTATFRELESAMRQTNIYTKDVFKGIR